MGPVAVATFAILLVRNCLLLDCCLIVAEEFACLCDPESYAGRSNSSRQGHPCQIGRRVEARLNAVHVCLAAGTRQLCCGKCHFRLSGTHNCEWQYQASYVCYCEATEQHSRRHAHAFRCIKCCVGPEGNVCRGQAFVPEFRPGAWRFCSLMMYNNNRKQAVADRRFSSKKAVAARLDACIGRRTCSGRHPATVTPSVLTVACWNIRHLRIQTDEDEATPRKASIIIY